MPRIRLLSASAFRQALVYLGLFSASVLVLLGFIYWSTAGFMSRQTDATIDAEITGLAEQYAEHGTIGLIRALERRVRDARASRGLYILADPNGRPLAGNLTRWPQEAPDAGGWLTFALEYADGAGTDYGRARVFALRGGFRLLVGRDIRERLQIAATIRTALFWGIALALVLSVAGGVLIGRPLLRRIDTINDTSREIMEGDLARRLPVGGSGDELDTLAGNLNAMLDRIERLVASMKEVSDNVAHDLRTPLARLRGGLEMALMEHAGESGHQGAIGRAIAEADAILETFNALLGIAQAQSGTPRQRFAPIELGTLVGDAVELYAPLAEERGQKIAANVETDAVVAGDRDLLFQALANLIDNAIKFSPAGGDIAVSLAGADDRARLIVADSGPGIPAAARGRVRERFVRLEESRSTTGSGLGLSLVDAVAVLHDGRLILEDNGPGLRVTIDLPVTDIRDRSKAAA